MLREGTMWNEVILASLSSFYESKRDGPNPPARQHSTTPVPSVSPEVRRSSPPVAAPRGNSGLSTSERKILDALASLETVGVEAPSKTQPGLGFAEAVRSGVVWKSGMLFVKGKARGR